MARTTSDATKTKTQMVREAIIKLQGEGREVTTAAIPIAIMAFHKLDKSPELAGSIHIGNVKRPGVKNT